MSEWSGEFSERSLPEMLRSQDENRAWSKQLRALSAALVNSRLAKEISPEEYATRRKLAIEEAAECRRRASVIANEIWTRHGYQNH